MRTSRITVVGVALLLLAPTAVMAAPDPLAPDPLFGTDGWVKVGWRGTGPSPRDVAVSNQNTVVAAVSAGAGSGESLLSLALVDPQGRRSTGCCGWGYLEPVSPLPRIASVVTTAQHTFVIGWQATSFAKEPTSSPEGYGYVAAFTANLQSPAIWGTEEFVYPVGATGLERLREVAFTEVTAGAIDGRGRVLVGGRIGGHAAVARLTAAGRIDRSFGSNGVAEVQVGNTSRISDLAAQRGLLLVGNSRVSTHDHQGFAARLTANGTPVSSWGYQGVLRIGATGSTVRAAESAGHGRWLVGYQKPDNTDAGVQKLDQTGRLVATFATGGRALVPCEPVDGRQTLDALATWRTAHGLRRIALALSCAGAGAPQRLAALWRPDGSPVAALAPDGVGPLPWLSATTDALTTADGQLIGLAAGRLYRLGAPAGQDESPAPDTENGPPDTP